MWKWYLLLLLLLPVACEHNTYDTGDGRYSYLQTAFVRAHTAANGVVDYCLTDNGDSLRLQPAGTAAWAATPDSLYRALLYYDKVTDGITTAVQLARVPVVRDIPATRIDTMYTDPLGWESAWLSADGRYLNLALNLKTGKADSADVRQVVAMVRDSVSVEGTKKTLHLRLLHRQNGVPQYYTVRQYVSMPLDSVAAGTLVQLTVNTYEGVQRRSFALYQ